MTRDTQTDLTEPLTSRESEVLDLLRIGLTNREIARRLAISPAGARYHVSEIIGKLGVRNRYEAAVWPKRPPWWLPAAAPGLMLWQQAKSLVPVKLSSLALAGSGVLVAAALGGIGLIVFLSLGGNGDGSAGLRSQAVTTVEEAYEALLAELRARQSVLHTTIATELVQGDDRERVMDSEVWVDAEQDAGRLEFQLSPDYTADLPEEGVGIFDDRYSYYPDDPDVALRQDEPVLCPGSDSLFVTALLQCGQLFLPFDADADASLETGVKYEGTPAIALLFQGVVGSIEEPTPFASRVYLDAETLLPIAHITRASTGEGETETVLRFEHEFVSRDSLAAGFLDPRSIGYGMPDAAKQLDIIKSEVPVYWLGEDVDLAGPEDLVLVQIETELTFPPDEAPYPEGFVYGRRLDYDTPSGSSGVSIFLWTPAEWERYVSTPQGQFLPDEFCAPSEPTSFAGEDAVIYELIDRVPAIAVDDPTTEQELCEKQLHELWLMPYDLIAVVELDDVVIDVRSGLGHFGERAPFDEVLATLRRR